MSTPNPTHIIAELLSVLDEHIYPRKYAKGLVLDLAEAGYSIVPSGDVEKLAEVRAEEARQVRWNAFCELSDLRCLDCNLRYGERKDYACPPGYPEIGGEHSYAEDDIERLTAAAAEGEKP